MLGMILQRFKLIDHKRYQLKIKESLTIKPEGLKIQVRPRTDRAPMAKSSAPIVVSTQPNGAAPDPDQGVKGDGRVLTVLYGTSLGTCRDIAGQIADRAGSSGFQVTNAALDDYADGLPETGTLVVVTSTYNGGAPDSATKMETAIREKRIGEVERPELTYAVLGVGNTQWKTYQAFPKLVESTLRQTGAKSLLARGEADGNGDFDEAVERWMGALWKALGEGDAPAAAAPRLKIAFSDAHATRASVLPEFGLSARGDRQRRAGRRRDGAVGLQQGAAALFHAAHDDPAAQGRNLSCGRSSGRLRPQPAGGRRQHHRAARAQARPGRGAGRQGKPDAASADRQAGHRAPAAQRFRGTAGCGDAERRARVARSHALPRHHQGAGQARSPRTTRPRRRSRATSPTSALPSTTC